MMNIRIKGSGSYTPENVMRNADFTDHVFLNEDGLAIKFPESIEVNLKILPELKKGDMLIINM